MFSLRALWKAVRRSSLVFSVVFALALFGFSLTGLLRSPLRALGLWWPLLFLGPFILIGWAAKLEARLQIGPVFRRRACLLLVFGSISLNLVLWWYQRELEATYAETFEPGPLFEEKKSPPALRRGPRGRP